MKLFDENGFLRLDEIVAQRPSFLKCMADHYITDDELKEQADTVRAMLQELDEKLSDEEEELVVNAICELAVLYEMNAQWDTQEGGKLK